MENISSYKLYRRICRYQFKKINHSTFAVTWETYFKIVICPPPHVRPTLRDNVMTLEEKECIGYICRLLMVRLFKHFISRFSSTISAHPLTYAILNLLLLPKPISCSLYNVEFRFSLASYLRYCRYWFSIFSTNLHS